MKYLFYLLILANLVAFLWFSGFRDGQDTDGSHRELAIPSGVERILLTRELADPSSSDAETPAGPAEVEAMAKTGQAEMTTTAEIPSAVPDASSTPPAVTYHPDPEISSEPAISESSCFQVGPFQAKARAGEIQDLMKAHSDHAEIIMKPGDVPNGWWVLFPKAESRDAARENRRMLAEKGVRDMWVFDKGPLQGAISLGLYDARERADAAQKRFADKNIVTEVAPRLVRGQVHWLKIPWHRPPLELDEVIQTLNSQDQEIRIPAPIPCS